MKLTFLLHDQKSRQKFKYPENEKSFEDEIKIIFKGPSLTQTKQFFLEVVGLTIKTSVLSKQSHYPFTAWSDCRDSENQIVFNGFTWFYLAILYFLNGFKFDFD